MNLTPEAASEEYVLKYGSKIKMKNIKDVHLAGQQRIIDMIPKIINVARARYYPKDDYVHSLEQILQMIQKGEL